jgi:hypothetical protein
VGGRAIRPIAKRIKEEILKDEFYVKCCRSSNLCGGRITWEHAFTYAGRQINERWAIIPLCWYHHLGKGLDKKENRRIAISRASDEDLLKYKKINWKVMKTKYGIF